MTYPRLQQELSRLRPGSTAHLRLIDPYVLPGQRGRMDKAAMLTAKVVGSRLSQVALCILGKDTLPL